MIEHFLSVYTSGALSGGIAVIPVATTYNNIMGTFPLCVAAGATGGAIGVIEPYGGNNDSSFDSTVTSTLPVNIRLFAPTQHWSITGVSGSYSAGLVVYFATGGQVTAAAYTTGSITAGITLSPATSNGDLIQIASLKGSV